MRSQTTRTIAGRVNANGSIAAGGAEFTVQKGAAGFYTVNLAPGVRLLGATAVTNGGQNMVRTDTYTDRSFGVTAFAPNTLAVTDAAFVFSAVVTA